MLLSLMSKHDIKEGCYSIQLRNTNPGSTGAVLDQACQTICPCKEQGCQYEYCATHSSSHSKFMSWTDASRSCCPSMSLGQRWVNAGSTLVPPLVSELPPLDFQTCHTVKEEYAAQNMNKKGAAV